MMEAEAKDSLPALFEHCVKVYEAMVQHSGVSFDADATTSARVYEGHLTRLFGELGLSTPYYTSVRRKLVQMGCIDQVRRGGGNAPSRWILRKPPTAELWNSATTLRRPKTDKLAQLEQRVNDLSRTVSELHGKVEALIGS
jgi:hypothetical protein